jgi:succinate dehydrogenase/fumarate reductase flavoprotein subunit
MTEYDRTVDLLVVGSGCGGFTAALAGKDAGLDTLVVEKGAYFGGSTVFSGGSIWVPNAPVIVRAGVTASRESVVAYLTTISDGTIAPGRIERVVDQGPEMLAFLEKSPHMTFEWRPDYPDYHPDAPGGSAIGRSVEVIPFDRRDLGDLEETMREPTLRTPRGMWIGSNDLHSFLGIRRGWAGKLMFLRLLGRFLNAKVTGAKITTRGEALMGRLRLVLRDAGVPLWLNAPIVDLITDGDGAVVGASIERDGVRTRVHAKKGVILATGGFDHNLTMRQHYQPIVASDWSMGAPELTGDGINAGQAVDAQLDLMDDAWWMPAVPWSEGKLGVLLFERQNPGQFIVNGAGRRYTNEAGPYTDFVHDMIAGEETGVSHVPSWLIIDDTSWRHTVFSTHLPLPRIPFAPVPTGRRIPAAWQKASAVVTARSWRELASEIGVPADNLIATAKRFNAFAEAGRDEDFHRGENAYDNYYGDPRRANPNLRPLDDGPYLAFKVVPGDLGTKGGLLTDENAQVLDTSGAPIPGLYATGNVSSAVTGHGYSGPGGTIGPAMTFGYVAARHAAQAV